VTAQIEDTVTYLGHEFALAGIERGDLFRPADYGINARGTGSACWRGSHCRYAVEGDALLLEELWVSLVLDDAVAAREGRGVPLAGRLPSYESLGPCKFHYERLAMPLDYTGGLLLGSGLMRFVYMGHQPAWQYQQVYELVFEGGRLIAADDRSGAMSVVRARLQQADGPPAADPSKDPISAWIERCFDRSYRR